ncbi:type II toxin-antitoxin system VapC family toxin [Nocardia sp. NPDC127579]|uniref:type II toxin-antitoxin system VapC family toxin n=1 Tax=Nocardia sp. NPDC127579 TaxID=3345402 RepID=UPI003634A359
MTGFLLDTCTISEWIKPLPDAGLMDWLHAADEDRLHVSAITFGELRKGIELMPEGARKRRRIEWLTGPLTHRFERRLLPVDGVVADVWGRMVARTKLAGLTIGATDVLIAATAETHGLEVVTRNVKDFEPTGVAVVSPWSG